MMAFNNFVPPLLNNEQAGAMPDIISKILGGYTQATNAGFLRPKLEEELKKAKLVNQYYGPNMESQIGLRGAHAGLLGEQTKGARIENQYLPQYKQAQIEQLQAQAQQARLMQMIREQLLGNNGQLNQQQQPLGMQNPQDNMYQGQGMPTFNNQPQAMTNQQQPASNLPNYAQASVMQKALGLGNPKIIEANGKYLAITPFGTIDTGALGLTEQQKNLAKEDAKKISKLEDVVLSGSQKQETFNELNSILGSESFEQLRQNPILGRHELGWYEKFGSPEQQEMIGKAKTHMGNIIKDSSRDFAGQFRIGEQALLNEMKPNASDSLDVMKGKSEALTFLNMINTKRAELEADYMRNNNMSALQARIAADKQIDPKEIKKEIRTILHPASAKKTTFNQSDLEFTAKKHGMTVDEVRERLESR